MWVGHSLNAIVHIAPGKSTLGVSVQVMFLQLDLSLVPLNDGRWVIQLPVAQVNAALQLGFPGLFPAPESVEHGTVEDQHDRARNEEGTNGGIHDIVVILQLTQSRVPIGNIVETKNDWGSHSESEDPGGGDQDQLPQVDLPPVVVQWNGDGNEPG